MRRLFNNWEKKIDDVVIVTKIKTAYLTSEQLNPFKIDISSRKGDETLKGKVDTDQQYEKAVIIAESVDGVKDVDVSQLEVER